MASAQERAPPSAPLSGRDLLCLALILAWGVWRLLPGLDHPSIHDWDEAAHQAAARGTFETFFFPHIYADRLYPEDPYAWWVSQVWLHKPPAPFWFGALMMHWIGVTPLALRLGSLLGELGAAAALYLLLRDLLGRAWAVAAAVSFLALPYGWILTQGYFFGDVTDCTLVGWVTLAMALLVYSIERDSWRWSAAAGAALGVAYLCKGAMGLAPLGVAAVLCVLAQRGLCRGPRPRALAAMTATLVGVAAPWNVYAALKWPNVFKVESQFVTGTVYPTPETLPELGHWYRPVDSIFNELNASELAPLPVILPLVAAIWLAVRAVRRREPVVAALALWLWATWSVHTVLYAKPISHLWNAVPAAMAALVITAWDARRTPALAGAILGAIATPWLIDALPFLARIRAAVPAFLSQTHRIPGLAEGVVVVTACILLVLVLDRLLRHSPWLRGSLGLLAIAGLGWMLLVATPREQSARIEANRDERAISYTRELGLALDPTIPKRSVLFEALDHDPPARFEIHNLMFWSGRMTYRRAPDPATAHARGYHPYLISPAAEPFRPVPGIPAQAWLRAYDLDAPMPPPGLPDGVTPLDVRVGNLHILGIASGPVDAEHDRYALFVHAEGVPRELQVAFFGPRGTQTRLVSPEQSLRRREHLAGAPWFIMPVLGPPRAQVQALEFGGNGKRYPGPGSRREDSLQ